MPSAGAQCVAMSSRGMPRPRATRLSTACRQLCLSPTAGRLVVRFSGTLYLKKVNTSSYTHITQWLAPLQAAAPRSHPTLVAGLSDKQFDVSFGRGSNTVFL